MPTIAVCVFFRGGRTVRAKKQGDALEATEAIFDEISAIPLKGITFENSALRSHSDRRGEWLNMSEKPEPRSHIYTRIHSVAEWNGREVGGSNDEVRQNKLVSAELEQTPGLWQSKMPQKRFDQRH